MKTASFLSLLAIALLIHSPVAAEFYRYTDVHGNVIFTDDLSKIPADKREEAKAYEESDRSPAPEPLTEAQSPSNGKSTSDTLEAIRQEGDRLQSVRDALDQEYNLLAEENSKLREEQKQAVTPDQVKAVNQKVVSFNTRFKAYQAKSEAFRSELDAYNRRVEAAETKQQE
jgi:DNA repair exonuclease SbcCD ATPase subunit